MLTNDTQYDEYEPVEPGVGNFSTWSDAVIEAYIESSPDNMPRAVGFAILGLALTAAKESKTVKDYDLQVDLSKRSADLRATATQWFTRADAQDRAAADIFEVFDTFGTGEFIPEASPAEWGREYGVGRWR